MLGNVTSPTASACGSPTSGRGSRRGPALLAGESLLHRPDARNRGLGARTPRWKRNPAGTQRRSLRRRRRSNLLIRGHPGNQHPDRRAFVDRSERFCLTRRVAAWRSDQRVLLCACLRKLTSATPVSDREHDHSDEHRYHHDRPDQIRIAEPGASTSMIRSPACAALLPPNTTLSVIRFGSANRSADKAAMPAMNRPRRRCRIRTVTSTSSNGRSVHTPPKNRPHVIPPGETAIRQLAYPLRPPSREELRENEKHDDDEDNAKESRT